MRIVVFSTLFPPNVVGGAERTVETLMLGLAERGAEVHVITIDPAKDHSRRQGPLQVHGVRLRNFYWPYASTHRPPAWRRAFWHARDIHNIEMAKASARLIRELRPDIVLTFNLQGFSTSVWETVKSIDGLPLVHVIQDYWLLCPRTTMFKTGRNCERSCLSCRLITRTRRHATRRPDAVVGISRMVLQRHLEEGLFPDVSIKRVIYNGRQVGEGVRAAPTAVHAPGPLRLGFLGRVSREKGFEHLLNELARLDDHRWTLLVGGRCPPDYAAKLGRRYALDRVEFLGFVDPEAFFPRIDVLVVPSLWHEPLGSVVIEAFCHGVPVIVSNRGGLPEMMSGETAGFVFDPDEPGALARLLGLLIREPGLLAPLRPTALGLSRRFSVERQVEAYAALLDEVRTANGPRHLGGRQPTPTTASSETSAFEALHASPSSSFDQVLSPLHDAARRARTKVLQT